MPNTLPYTCQEFFISKLIKQNPCQLDLHSIWFSSSCPLLHGKPLVDMAVYSWCVWWERNSVSRKKELCNVKPLDIPQISYLCIISLWLAPGNKWMHSLQAPLHWNWTWLISVVLGCEDRLMNTKRVSEVMPLSVGTIIYMMLSLLLVPQISVHSASYCFCWADSGPPECNTSSPHGGMSQKKPSKYMAKCRRWHLLSVNHFHPDPQGLKTPNTANVEASLLPCEIHVCW